MFQRARSLCLLWLCSCAVQAPLPQAPTALNADAPSWQVAFVAGGDVDIGIVDTTVCFDGAPPPRVGPEWAGAVHFLADLPRAVDRRGRPLSAQHLDVVIDGAQAGIDTRAVPAGACVAFAVDVERAAKEIHQRDRATTVGASLLISPDVWLWRPKPWPTSAGGRLAIADTSIVVTPFDDVVRSSVFALQSYGALGSFSPCAGGTSQARCRMTIVRDGVRLDIARLDDGGPDDDTLIAWLTVAIADTATPYGRFPTERVTVLIVPQGSGRPIQAGFLGRGGGASAVFYVAKEAINDDDALDPEGRWVLTHELSHALLPPIVRSDAWLNEGLATWHQEMLPALAGRREKSVARAQLQRGFDTGVRRARQSGISLARACDEMDARHAYQHCYWGGAALFELLARELGDDAVVKLVQAMQARAAIDAAPRTALALLDDVKKGNDARAKTAAKTLWSLWLRHRDGLFPIVSEER